MAAKGPKPWKLSEEETFASYTSWQHNLLYHLKRDDTFKTYVTPNAIWGKLTSDNPNRGFTDIQNGATAATQAANLNEMLGYISQWIPHYLANDILRNTTSLGDLWQFVRKYYGFQQSEANFLKFSTLTWEQGERPERLYQRVLAHLQDNLLQSGSRLKHNGEVPTKDEDMSPSLERIAVLKWLELLHPSMPSLVARTFANDLQKATLKDLQPLIVDALDGFLEELKGEDVRSSRVFTGRKPTKRGQFTQKSAPSRPQCRVCRAEGRAYYGHTIYNCEYISKAEKRDLVHSFKVSCDTADQPSDDDLNFAEQDTSSDVQFRTVLCAPSQIPTVNKVTTLASPTLSVFYAHNPTLITCDSGATSSLIKHSTALKLGVPISPTSHTASQADGKTKMDAVGEVHATVTRGDRSFKLEALCVKDLDCDILGGVPFMRMNNIVLDIPNDCIIIDSTDRISYNPCLTGKIPLGVRRSQSFLLRANSRCTIYPGDFVEIQKPGKLNDDIPIAVEPRKDNSNVRWLEPDISVSIDGAIRLLNSSPDPISIRKHQHIAQAYHTSSPEEVKLDSVDSIQHIPPVQNVSNDPDQIVIDPDGQLSKQDKLAFYELHNRYANVFNRRIGKYNDASGRLRASINMGPVDPPPQKAHLPAYTVEKMKLMQDKMDELEDLGVLSKPELVGVKLEYVSPSFLVNKGDGTHRLVTAFTNIASYAKPAPSKSCSTDSILQFLAGFRYIIKTDMTKQFFQMQMDKHSMKYLGTLTPFKGLRVYTRAAMGMPGSTEHLDELMSRVLGNLLHEGIAMKIADDLYVGGQSIADTLHNWEKVLHVFELNNLRLSASKTVICPINTTILGWIWSNGRVSVSPHKISPLATSTPPKTVKSLRSWCGAFKHLKPCIPQYSSLLHDLEALTAGKDSKCAITWSDDLMKCFKAAQGALTSLKSITIPKSSDQLIITTDGAIKPGGIGSVLYVMRNKKMSLGGYFSAKLKSHQLRWLPCEVEALGISSAVRHWATYITAAESPVQILTDSRPCVQAYAKLKRGEFSSSARVSTFLSTLSSHPLSLQYIKGSNNVPADYCSRHPSECDNNDCQICQFIKDSMDVSVNNLTVRDILSGSTTMPYVSPAAWKTAQQDCAALRRCYAHLVQGTRPNKKDNNVKDVKKYLKVCTVGRDGTLIVRRDIPFAATRDLIVIPRHVLTGLISAIHIQLQHPSKYQLLQVLHRYFYALDLDKVVSQVTEHCSICSSLATMPTDICQYSTSPSPTSPGGTFSCDILCRARQRIFVLRDSFSAFTVTRLIPNEQSNTLRETVIEASAELRCPSGCIIRVDNAPGFRALTHDRELAKYKIMLQYGREKNVNKNPQAEKAIQELERELKRLVPTGDPISPSQLAVATSTLNMRLRNRGLSAKEILYQRDNQSGEQLNFVDSALADMQYRSRIANHPSSAKSHATSGKFALPCSVHVGDLVYVKKDGDKHRARDKYVITSIQGDKVFANRLVGAQFRAKAYELKATEVYPVAIHQTPTFSPRHIKANPYDSDGSSSDDTEDGQVQEEQNYESQGSDSDHNSNDEVQISDGGHDSDQDDVQEVHIDENVVENTAHDSDSISDGLDTSDIMHDDDETVSVETRPHRASKRPQYLEDYVTT